MKTIFLSTALNLFLFFSCGQNAQAQTALSTITIRSTNALATPIQKALTEIAKPEVRDVPSGSDPLAELKSFCGGSYTNDYFDAVKSLPSNKGFVFGPISTQRQLTLPGCLKVNKETNLQITALPNDTIASVITRSLGVKWDDIITICDPTDPKSSGIAASPRSQTKCVMSALDAINLLNSNTWTAQDRLPQDRKLIVPSITRATTIVLKEGISADFAITKLRNAATATFKSLDVKAFAAQKSPDLHLLAPLESTSEQIQNTACVAEAIGPSMPWPFNADELKQALTESRTEATRRKFYTRFGVIRVADTGFAGLDVFFPESGLAVNTLENKNPTSPTGDKDRNRRYNDYYGIDATNTGEIGPYNDDPYKLHGTQVADWAIGGYAFRSKYGDVYELVKLSFAKIFSKSSGPISVDYATMLGSMDDIENHPQVRVVNFSVGANSEQNTQKFENRVLEALQRNFLVVIAAGNDSKDITYQATYPASYGGTGVAANWILTVAASGPNRKPTRFTNRSAERVDLLAPGCRLPFSMDGRETVELHGTSFAAPLVSFTAAMVYALGVTNMRDVKTRIISSADFDPLLERYSRYSAILNIERAVSLFKDSIRENGARKDMRGKWITPPDGRVDICEDEGPLDVENILSINVLKPKTDPLKLRIRLKTVERWMSERPIVCAPKESGITFRDLSGRDRPIAWSELTTLVPAWFAPEPSP